IAITSLMSFGSIRRAAADEVADLYVKKCATCHGRDGKGNTVMGKKLTIRDLTNAENMAKLTDAQIEDQIRNGVKDKDTGKERMLSFKDKLTDDQIKSLTKYVRTLK
ncbi:MAG: c-type cytochrome, partial [Polyangia bacterium]